MKKIEAGFTKILQGLLVALLIFGIFWLVEKSVTKIAFLENIYLFIQYGSIILGFVSVVFGKDWGWRKYRFQLSFAIIVSSMLGAAIIYNISNPGVVHLPTTTLAEVAEWLGLSIVLTSVFLLSGALASLIKVGFNFFSPPFIKTKETR